MLPQWQMHNLPTITGELGKLEDNALTFDQTAALILLWKARDK